VVKAVVDNGLGVGLGRLLPQGSSLPALLEVATVAVVMANLINNLPAILVLLPVVATSGPGPVLAALVGVNLGPNLTYVGSLATLLWRRVLPPGVRLRAGPPWLLLLLQPSARSWTLADVRALVHVYQPSWKLALLEQR
jgi:hypothetical protein